jgi:hypothetical protein
MENRTKQGTVLILIGLALFISAFVVGVSAAGVILLASAISVAGYGAGSIMNSPCGMVGK